MSSTIEQNDLVRSFYNASVIAIAHAALLHDDPFFDLLRGFGPRFPAMASRALAEHGPHLVGDIEAGRATLEEAVHVGLARVDATLRRHLVGERSAGAGATS